MNDYLFKVTITPILGFPKLEELEISVNPGGKIINDNDIQIAIGTINKTLAYKAMKVHNVIAIRELGNKIFGS